MTDTATPSTSRGQPHRWSRQLARHGLADGHRANRIVGLASRPYAVFALCLLAVAFGVWQVAIAWEGYWQHVGLFAGADFRIVTWAAERWLQGDGFYWPYQLAGSYTIGALDHVGQSPIMYPPTMLLLLVPFTVLPAVLWWAIPIAVTAWVVWQHHPKPYVWPVLVLLLVMPTTLNTIATGNPTLWFTMALALGTRNGWAVLLLLKPTIAPFALLGIWRRGWWLGLAALAAVSLAFLPMWFDYLTVLGNTTHRSGILYSLNQWPVLMIPVLAWLARVGEGPHPTTAAATRGRVDVDPVG